MRDKAAVKMTESPKATKKEADKKAPAKPAQDLNVDIRASKTQELRDKITGKTPVHKGFGALKISAVSEGHGDILSERPESFDHDEEPVLLLKPSNQNISLGETPRTMQIAGAAGSSPHYSGSAFVWLTSPLLRHWNLRRKVSARFWRA